MGGVLDRLARTPVLLAAFVIFLAAGALFGVFRPAVGGTLLDLQLTADAARSVLGEMSQAQRSAHVQLTLFLDTLYPLAYGAFLTGVAWRFGGALRGIAILPASIGVLVDFAENALQVAALTGSPDWLAGKDIITPMKFGAIALAALIALVLLLMALLRRVMARG